MTEPTEILSNFDRLWRLCEVRGWKVGIAHVDEQLRPLSGEYEATKARRQIVIDMGEQGTYRRTESAAGAEDLNTLAHDAGKELNVL